jgi:signal transduction histidine kinase
MILNLAINARDAMPSGGTLTIEMSRFDATFGYFPDELSPSSYVAISVSDTGVGMTQDVLAKALDPFFTTKPQARAPVWVFHKSTVPETSNWCWRPSARPPNQFI